MLVKAYKSFESIQQLDSRGRNRISRLKSASHEDLVRRKEEPEDWDTLVARNGRIFVPTCVILFLGFFAAFAVTSNQVFLIPMVLVIVFGGVNTELFNRSHPKNRRQRDLELAEVEKLLNGKPSQ